MVSGEQFRGVAHSDGDVAPQLVISVSIGGAIHVLVNTSLIHKLGIHVELVVLVLVERHPEAPFEVVLHLLSPISELHLHFFAISVDFNSVFLHNSLLVKLVQPSQDRVLHCYQFNGGSIPRSGRHSSIASGVRTAHFVHPSSTVVLVAPKAEASLLNIAVNLDVEPFVLHVGVDLSACIPLSEFDALAMPLHYLDYELKD